jgi:predicted acetyltransferase
MTNFTLRQLNIKDKDQFIEATNVPWENGFVFAHYWESLGKGDYEKYRQIIGEMSQGLNLQKGHVPCTTLFAFDENEKLVGRSSIRHELNAHLLKEGGHIGYGVLPEFRGNGYATSILKTSIDYIKENLPELKKALVTCDEDNIASRRTIEKNGGVLENTLELKDGTKKMRFWISIN